MRNGQGPQQASPRQGVKRLILHSQRFCFYLERKLQQQWLQLLSLIVLLSSPCMYKFGVYFN